LMFRTALRRFTIARALAIDLYLFRGSGKITDFGASGNFHQG